MKKSLALVLLTMAISGCNTQVQDFVDVLPGEDNSSPPAVDLAPNTLKISPGEVRGASAGLGLKATISPTQQKMASANLGMTVGISKVSKK